MNKNLGQVFTPHWIVAIMLDCIGYKGQSILTKTIMEPSFGDGAFLKEIVQRYIEAAMKEGWSPNKIRRGLEASIYGIEIDELYYRDALLHLDRLCADYGITGVSWQLLNGNTLTVQDFYGQMDYVVGNPPYVRIHNMEESLRNYLKTNYLTCQKGTIDLYVAFFELGIQMLNEAGKLSFITPNSFMYNKSADYFRTYIEDNLYLHSLINFSSTKIFEAATYTAITTLTKSKNPTFDYFEYIEDQIHFVDTLSLEDYRNQEWNLSSLENQNFIRRFTTGNYPLSAICNTQYGFTTMRDKIYISKDVEVLDEGYVLFKGHKVEREVLRKIIKGSVANSPADHSYLLFPYTYNEGYEIVHESLFKELYPYAYAYLSLHKEELLKRDMDKNYTAWYQFGRSQGLSNMHKEKLVVKHIVRNADKGQVQILRLPADTYVYSGIFITGDNLEKVQQILESEEFFKYVCLTGKDMSGGYKTITTKMIKQFTSE